MMKLNMKSSLMMTAMAAMMAFAATGCTDEDTATPAERLLKTAQDSNKRLDNLMAHHDVLTTQIVSEMLLPIDKASDAFNAELLAWKDNPADADYQTHELDAYAKAGVEITNLSAKLGAQGFELSTTTADTCSLDGSGGSGSGCSCDEVTTPTDGGSGSPPSGGSGTTQPPSGGSGTTYPSGGSGTITYGGDTYGGTGLARRSTASDPNGLDLVTEKVYWKRVGCKTACTLGQTALVSACQPLIETVVPYALCVAAAVAWGEACKAACDKKYPGAACF